MFIELIDALRCTADHADSWLVASISRRSDRFVTAGTLGCPICLREYPIQDGVVHFGDPQRSASSITSAARKDAVQPLHEDAEEEDATRIGAFLAVAEGSIVLLAGDWARAAHALSGLVPSRIFVLNPSEPIDESEAVGIVMSSEGIPLSAGSLRGVALDRTNATATTLASAVKVLAAGGRLVAPADAAVPAGATVIAQDEQFWVAEKMPPLLALVHR